MAEKYKIFDVDITKEATTFESLFGKRKNAKEYDFQGVDLVRKLLSNQKTRLLNTIKMKKPKSVYELAKLIGRDFKSVTEDVKILSKFGLIDLVAEKTGKRARLKPVLLTDRLQINIKL